MRILFFLFITLVFVGCKINASIQKDHFVAERLSRSATLVVNDSIETVFPLFLPKERMLWDDSWNPEFIYPKTFTVEVGSTFKTKGDISEGDHIWRISKYNSKKHIVEYMVTSKYRSWTVTIQARRKFEDSLITKLTVTHTYLGLTPEGNNLNELDLEKYYSNDLQNWEIEVNKYLEIKEKIAS